ncbi:uncharacterized protein LOC116845624 isoform X2 [Odontomachus brunneus]|nr:uncharacterized protein LOC116845624 isoform X2 [Odontomachus brunneus]XP_032674433.1 uncharacterized protein LOC116845624 isoform X2 [Odontomachus brunneus]
MSGKTEVDKSSLIYEDKIFNTDSSKDANLKKWKSLIEKYSFWSWMYLHSDEIYLHKASTIDVYQMFRKDIFNGSSDPLRQFLHQDIVKCFEKGVNFDQDTEVESVEDESINHMEVEESHAVEKDIVPKDLVKDSEDEEEDSTDKNVQEAKSKTYKEMKKSLRSLVPKRSTKQQSNFGCYVLLKMFLSLLVPLCVVFTSLVFREQSYQHSTIFANVTAELKKRIYGQDRAVEAMGEYLRLNEPTLKVIALVGGTGVGKSYTIEIVESNFPKYSVRRYFPPIVITMNDVGFSFLYPKLIVLENLKEHDLAHVVDFLKIRENVATNQYITVLAVFNVEHMNDNLTRNMDLERSAEAIRNSFANENLDVKVITYEPLGEDVLKKCIADAVHHSGMTLSDHDVEFVKQQLMINNVGCKGAYSKVQVIGRQ